MTTTSRPDPTVHTAPGRRRRRGITVALVGADGAGKSTLSRLLQAPGALPRPVKTIYMGVNLEASSLMLPTTRALLSVKRARGAEQEPAAAASVAPGGHHSAPGTASGSGWRRSVKDAARLGVWAAEEWVRQVAAVWYTARGYIVVFDRHFFADFYYSGTAAGAGQRGASVRLHDWMLRRLYPKPDLTLCLDAPAEVLFARKREDSPAFLAQRRQQYLDLAAVVPAYALVDASRPVDAVLGDVTEAISARWARSG